MKPKGSEKSQAASESKGAKSGPVVYVPAPSKAKSDYIQNCLQLPKEKRNLEIMLRDVQLKGFFDHELNYRLRKKEATEELKHQLQSQLQSNRVNGAGSEPSALTFNPLLEAKRNSNYLKIFQRDLRES